MKESLFSKTYTPRNGNKGYLEYVSYMTYQIAYNQILNEWHLTSMSEILKWTWASSKASRATGVLGTHEWSIFNDTNECGGNLEATIKLSLTSCNETQFTCNDGLCISMDSRCNGREDCYDKSDELNCQIVDSDPSYNKGMIPPPLNSLNQAGIELSIDVHRILAINEIQESFQISYSLILTWKDPRLSYHNLKKNSNLNVLSSTEQSSVWRPIIVLLNTKSRATVDPDKNTLIKAIVNEDFIYSVTDISHLQNIYVFDGKRNSLEMKTILDTDFICEYDMALYPFDTQTCTLDFVLTDVADDFCFLTTGKMQYFGPSELTQYFIKDKFMTNTIIMGQKGIKVYFILGRRLLSNILTVYLPTVLLNLIGHLTVYFKPFFFEVLFYSLIITS